MRNAARVVQCLPANVGDTTTIRCRFIGYWAWARVSVRGETAEIVK